MNVNIPTEMHKDDKEREERVQPDAAVYYHSSCEQIQLFRKHPSEMLIQILKGK